MLQLLKFKELAIRIVEIKSIVESKKHRNTIRRRERNKKNGKFDINRKSKISKTS